MTRIAVLRNPTAGRGRHAGTVAAALSALEAPDRTVEILDADTIDEALAACREAVADGADALVAVGGDGTVHVGLQAVAGTKVGFGVLPAGTGNDFATATGIPNDVLGAARLVSQALTEGRSAAIDAARIAGLDGFDRWFCVVLGAGLDAIVLERANAMRWPKGRRRYDIAIFAELMRLRPRRYRLTLDGQTTEQDAVLVAIANTPTYGGGLKICPDASPIDGLLDVIIAGPMSRPTMVRLQAKVHQGTHVRHPAVSIYRVQTARIEADGITAYADGERACPLPITVTAHPGAVRLLR